MIIKKVMPKIPVAKKRVAAYCRVSTFRNEQDESFETQQKYYEELIQSHPDWELVKVYADRHSATRVKNRPGFQEMAAAAEAKKLDIIICKSISRFSRNMVDCQQYAKWFRTLGVTIIFEEQNIRTDDPTCDFVLSILAAVAQDESHSISENEKAAYVPLDKDWTGFSTDEYQKASESVMSELEDTRQIEYKAGLDMRGYEVVRSQYFSTTQNPAMTIADGKLSFNTACLKKFENVEYVELLLNSVNRCIAVRPCDGNNPNAIHWGKLREGRWCALSKSCRGLAKTLFDIMDWDQDLKYRFRGDFIENDDQKVMLFQLDEPEMVKTENIVLPPKEAETDDRAEIAGRTVKQIIYILPPEWEDTFGRPITSIGEINLLEQRHYAADWDVLRPAKELAEYSTLTSEDLEELLQEAEKIIEGWPIPDEHGTGETADNGDGESADVGTECGSDVGEGTEENRDRADF